MPTLNKTRRNVHLMLAASVMLFITIGVAFYISARLTVNDAARVAHTEQAITRINEVHIGVLSIMAAGRGYIVSGQAEHRLMYLQALGQLPAAINRLTAAVSESAGQRANLETLRTLIEKRLTQVGITIEAFDEGGFEHARTGIPRDALVTNEALSAQIDNMIRVEKELLEERMEASNRSASWLMAASLGGIPLGLCLVALVYALLSRELKRRILAEHTTASSSAHLQTTIQQLQATSSDLNALGDYSGYLQSCENVDEALVVTAQLMTRLAPDISGFVYLTKASKNYLELTSQWGPCTYPVSQIMYPNECWCLRRGQHHFSELISHSPNCAHVTPTLASGETWLCVEMASQGVQLGVVVLQGPSERVHERSSILEAGVEQLALSVSSLQLRLKLKYQSTRDELTGLYNRRYLEDAFDQLHSRSVRHEKPYSLLMLDIDHFKNFNDTFGHAGGDAVLVEVGKLMATLRSEDISCRYGGEEFAIALPDADSEQAKVVAERIRERIQHMVVELAGKTLPTVTASIGIATFPSDGTENNELRIKADLALYRAKREGRNRVIHFDPSLDITTKEVT
ncbi:sensor domain-containing diguanylate cyclase [Pseudomonas sp. Marseille-QA0892]